MESPPCESDKMFKEHEDKCTNVVCSFFGRALIVLNMIFSCASRNRITTHDIFSKVRIGESSADRLVYEENVCNFVPRIRIKRGFVCACYSTWSLLVMMVEVVYTENL
jgi:hypothetical protein